MLKISTTLSLPLGAVTQRAALLAVSGAGKSNAARAMAEEFFAARLPFVAVDPKGDWWGLRAGSDGTAKGGLDVVIFGGEHGDIPLERGGGILVADTIVDQRLSCVVDLSAFESEADKKVFLLDFAKRLYHRNRDPLHLFLEEADDYLPQKPMHDEARLLRAFENIVRRGRSRGLGITLITQRSAVVNKNVLTQVETLFALRTTGPQDIAAIEAWMKYHGADREMLGSLAGLEDGEAWVWSPHHLKKTQRFRFRRSHTFDSGATPTNHKAGSRRAPATLADVDIAKLAEKMAATIERAAADDPKALHKRIAELERQLRNQTPTVDRSAELAAALAERDVARAALETFRRKMGNALATLSSAITDATSTHNHLSELSEAAKVAGAHNTGATNGAAKPWRTPDPPPAREQLHTVSRDSVRAVDRRLLHPSPQAPRANGSPTNGERLSKTEASILGALLHRGPMGKVRLALLAGYKHSAGHFGNMLGSLRSAGWLEPGNPIALTEAGRARAKGLPPPMSGDDLLNYWANKLGAVERAVLFTLPRSGAEMERTEVADKARYKDGTGHWGNGLGALRSHGLMQGSKRLSFGADIAQDLAS